MAERAICLMSVYAGERPQHLDAALASIARQTRIPDKMVLVQDGPLGAALSEVIERHRRTLPMPLRTVSLPVNLGLAGALNAGLAICDGEYVLRMDSDDLSPPDRFEKLLAYMSRHPEVGVLGTAMMEFEDSPSRPVRIKPVALEHDEIAAVIPWRNPINHATCCYRTRLVTAAGGYPHLLYLEDYYLWSILLSRGVRFHNLAEPLYLCRFDRGTLGRRGGWVNFRNECYLRWFLYRAGQSGIRQLIGACALQLVLRFAPLPVRERLWAATRQRLG